MKRNLALTVAVAAIAAGSPAAAAIPVNGDPILYWNELAAGLITAPPPVQSRAFAMLNTAMHDAVNSAYGGANNYYNTGVAAPGGNVRAAAAVAARNVLVAVNPANTAAYDAALAGQLSQISNGAAKTNGMTTGAAYASAMLLARANDGSTNVVAYPGGTNPGQWRPTPVPMAPAALPQWGGVTPFHLTSGSQFRPAAPPALGSPEYLAAYNEVKEIGSLTSATRTADQTNSALFWDASNGTTWIRIGVDVLADDGRSTIENASIMAKMSTAISDSIVAGWDAKYTFGLWRPITAIREGDADGVAETAGDAGWSPLFNTPAHPAYPSGHSLQSGAATAVLLSLGIDQSFCNTIAGDTRCFTDLGTAAQDAANSRLWGGIHFRFDNEIGLQMGQTVAGFTLAQDAFNAVPEPASWAMMIAGFGLVGATARRRARVAFA